MIRTRNRDEFLVDLSVPGTQSAATHKRCFVVPFACTLKGLYSKLGTAGTTSTQITDVNKNGTTIFASATKISNASGSVDPTYGTFTGDPTTFAKGDVITVDVDQINTTPGVNLCILLHLQRGSNRIGAVQTGSIGADAE